MDSRVNSFFIESKQFYISNNQLQSSETVILINNLDNNTSNHQITLSEKIVLSIFPTFYVFNLSNDLQYNDIKFKGLLIDLDASAPLTDSIGQLKALQ